MTGERVAVYFRFGNELNKRFFKRLLSDSTSFGCRTTVEADENIFEATTYANGIVQNEVLLDSAATLLTNSDHITIPLLYKNLKIVININNVGETSPKGPYFSLLIWHSQFKQAGDEETEEGIEERVNQFATIIGKFFESTHPIIAYGGINRIDKEHHPSLNSLTNHDPEIITWLNVYSPELADQMGREKIKSLPWWECRELATGGLLLLATMKPLAFGEMDETSQILSSELGLQII